MTVNLLLEMVLIALLAVVLYTFIGFIPGTDETSVLLPISLTLVLTGIKPILILTFFIASIITLNLTNLMPTALVGLPGGVLSSPMIGHALNVKERGQSAKVIQKMAAAVVIAVVISIPTSLLIAQLIAPFASVIQPYSGLLFVIGAVFLSLLSKNKLLSIISIVPLALTFMAFRHLYWGLNIVESGKSITTSFFLAITIGPLIMSLLSLLNHSLKSKMIKDNFKTIILNESKEKLKINPFKILNKEESKWVIIISFISNFLFILSPVGLIILFGEWVFKRVKENKETVAMVVMSALAQSTYLSGIIIPLFALGIPLSPVAIGPGNALFNAPPVYGIENNLHYQLNLNQFLWAITIGGMIAVVLSYFFTNKYAYKITNFVLTKISHEAVLGIFIAFVLLLAYMDAGVINVFGVIALAIISGSLNNLGVNYGVQFMTLYAAPLIASWLTL